MTVACGAATAMLVLVDAGEVALGIAMFAIAHATHLLATSLYNSYLPLIVAPARFARVSGLAWGLSYLGSVACFLLCLPFTRDGLAPANVATFALAFPVTAAFLVAIGLPAVMGLPADAPSGRGEGRTRPVSTNPVDGARRGDTIATCPSSCSPTISSTTASSRRCSSPR